MAEEEAPVEVEGENAEEGYENEFAEGDEVPDEAPMAPPTEEELRDELVRASLTKIGASTAGDRVSALHLEFPGTVIEEDEGNLPYLQSTDPVAKYKYLQSLNLSGHNIDNVASLSCLSHLIHLNLSNNNLLTFRTKPALSTLVELDLSNNHICTTDGFEEYFSLRRLNMAGNNISEVGSLSTVTTLQELSLERNKLTSIAGIETLSKLKILNINQNHVKQLEGMGCMDNLQMIFVRKNMLTSLRGLVEGKLPSLTVVDAASNEISRPSEVVFITDKENLRSLDLSGNPIENMDNYRFLIVFALPMLTVLDNAAVTPQEKVKAANLFHDDPRHNGVVTAEQAANATSLQKVLAEVPSSEQERSDVIRELKARLDPGNDATFQAEDKQDFECFFQRVMELKEYDALEVLWDVGFIQQVCSHGLFDDLRKLVERVLVQAPGLPNIHQYEAYIKFLDNHVGRGIRRQPEQSLHVAATVGVGFHSTAHYSDEEKHPLWMRRYSEQIDGVDKEYKEPLLLHLVDDLKEVSDSSYADLRLRFSPCGRILLLIREEWCVGLVDVRDGTLHFSERYAAVANKQVGIENTHPNLEPWQYLRVSFRPNSSDMLLSFSNCPGLNGEVSVSVNITNWHGHFTLGSADPLVAPAGPVTVNPLHGLVRVLHGLPKKNFNPSPIEHTFYAGHGKFIVAETWARAIVVHNAELGDILWNKRRAPPPRNHAPGSRQSWRSRIEPIVVNPCLEPMTCRTVITTDPNTGAILVSPPMDVPVTKYASTDPLSVDQALAESDKCRISNEELVNSFYRGGSKWRFLAPVEGEEKVARWRTEDGRVRDAIGYLNDFCDGVSTQVLCESFDAGSGVSMGTQQDDIHAKRRFYFEGILKDSERYQDSATCESGTLSAEVVNIPSFEQGANYINETCSRASRVVGERGSTHFTIRGNLPIVSQAISSDGQKVAVFSSRARQKNNPLDFVNPFHKELVVINAKDAVSRNCADTTALTMAISSNGGVVAVAYSNNVVRLVSVDHSTERFTQLGDIQLPCLPTNLIFSPDGRFVYVCTVANQSPDKNEMFMCDVMECAVVCRVFLNRRRKVDKTALNLAEYNSCSISQDGSTLAVGTASGIFLLDTQALEDLNGFGSPECTVVAENVGTVVKDYGRVHSLCFGQGGMILAVCHEKSQQSLAEAALASGMSTQRSNASLRQSKPASATSNAAALAGNGFYSVDILEIERLPMMRHSLHKMGVASFDPALLEHFIETKRVPVIAGMKFVSLGSGDSAQTDRLLMVRTNYFTARFDMSELEEAENSVMPTIYNREVHFSATRVRGSQVCGFCNGSTACFGEGVVEHPINRAPVLAENANFVELCECDSAGITRRLELPAHSAAAINEGVVAVVDTLGNLQLYQACGQ